MEPLLNSSSYILVPKKNFVRYALPYEVLPTFMCCEVNQKKVFDKEIAKSLFSQESVANENLMKIMMNIFHFQISKKFTFLTKKI